MTIAGVTIFGPGSEWLWAMAQFLALATTGFAIFRQLKAQAWANQFAIFHGWNDDWKSSTMTRYKLAWHIQVAERRHELSPARALVGEWLNARAAARYNGHVNPRTAWEEFGEIAQIYWALILPLVPEFRTTHPGLWKDWERWLPELAERDRKAGSAIDLSPERLARWVPETIAFFMEQLRVEEDAKAGSIPTGPIPAPVMEQDA